MVKEKNEYELGKLKFEGEYLNGKKWDGKGYDDKENIIYELKNGAGYMKEYDNDTGKLIFEGEYLKGEKNGKGKEYENNELKFEGEYLNGKKWNGKGYDDNNNVIYELKNGAGYMKEYDEDTGTLIYEVEYLNGELNGKFKRYDYYLGKLEFECEYLNGKMNGKMKSYTVILL